MTTDIYEQHRAAFPSVAAYTVAREGALVAKIAFKYPRNGAGRLYAYVHWIGCPMVRGFAGGGGYDKHSAATAHAASKMPGTFGQSRAELADVKASYYDFLDALRKDDGACWDNRLRNAGFEVWQAV